MNLDQKLEQASEGLRQSTQNVRADLALDRPASRAPVVLALGVLMAALGGFAVYNNRGDSVDSVYAANQQDPAPPSDSATSEPISPEPTTTEPPTTDAPSTSLASLGVPPYLTDGAPSDLDLIETQSADDFDEPLYVMVSQTYVIEGQPGPLDGDPRLSISWFRDQESTGGLHGDEVTVRGSAGSSQPGAIGFIENGFQVWVASSTLTEQELLDIANGLEMTDAGPLPVADAPGDLVAAPARHNGVFRQYSATVPLDGHTASYGAGPRNLTIFTRPIEDTPDTSLWGGAYEERMIGDRSVWIETDSHGQAMQAFWNEAGVRLNVLALGLTEEELLAAIEGTRPATADEW